MSSRKIGSKPSLMAKLNRFEKGYAIIRLADGQEIFWPKELLPKEIQLGDNVHLVTKTDQDYHQDSQELAKNILEQIINGKP